MKKRSSCKINGFKYPAADQISGRTSTICRSMACTLLERKACSIEDEKTWMEFFPERKCAYCGKPASHLDHLYPLIDNREPTGYGTEPANLVPCCRECNQLKGNMNWKIYMKSDKCKHDVENFKDVATARKERIKKIESFQEKMPAKRATLDADTIREWNKILSTLDKALKEAQKGLLSLQKKIYK